MNVTKAITLRLDSADYERLEAEAAQLGVRPATLVRVYVRAGLAGNMATEAAKKRRLSLEALDHLAALTADLPPIDAVQVAREGRAELEQRPFR